MLCDDSGRVRMGMAGGVSVGVLWNWLVKALIIEEVRSICLVGWLDGRLSGSRRCPVLKILSRRRYSLLSDRGAEKRCQYRESSHVSWIRTFGSFLKSRRSSFMNTRSCPSTARRNSCSARRISHPFHHVPEPNLEVEFDLPIRRYTKSLMFTGARRI
jgi:hypothetical protein